MREYFTGEKVLEPEAMISSGMDLPKEVIFF